jgi:aquaporin TIP
MCWTWAGAWVLKMVTTGEDVARHAVGEGVTVVSAVVMEAVLTFTLMFVVFATAVDPKKGAVGVIAPLAIGFTVLAQIFVGAPFSGASMNPGRSFGPAVVAWDFTNLWVYWVGPFLGAALAALVYDGLFISPAPPAGHEAIPSSDF